MTEIIREKINLLKDFCIIARSRDPREKLIREALESCSSEIHMENMLRDILIGNTTIEEMLSKKGLM